MKELSVPLNQDSKVPIYHQIYEFIKKEIRENKIEAKTMIPSTRALASHLNVSRSTVQMAYDQLLSEGYIEAVACKGYFVNRIESLYNIEVNNNKKINKEKTINEYDVDFSPNGIALEYFPYNAWRKVSKNVLLMEQKDLFNMGDSKGDLEFRQTIAGYLHDSRGVNCNAENIILGAGTEYILILLDMILDDYFGRKVSYAMENPTYPKAYSVLRTLDREVFPIGLDDYGMKTDELSISGADVAYVTPSHQFPLGIIMSIIRRTQMLTWANGSRERFIIEDDYDSEFRYKGKPIPSLQGIDKAGKVIYIGTFSKSIAPGIRMGYMVLPECLMASYDKVGGKFANTVARIDQNIVDLFIKEGYYERHLNKMRSLYKIKHDILLNEIKKFGKEFEVTGESAGLHILLSSDRYREDELISLAKQKRIKVYPLSGYYIEHKTEETKKATVILGYARLSEAEIVKGIDRLVEAYCGEDM